MLWLYGGDDDNTWMCNNAWGYFIVDEESFDRSSMSGPWLIGGKSLRMTTCDAAASVSCLEAQDSFNTSSISGTWSISGEAVSDDKL